MTIGRSKTPLLSLHFKDGEFPQNFDDAPEYKRNAIHNAPLNTEVAILYCVVWHGRVLPF